jgi:hypothetical protein
VRYLASDAHLAVQTSQPVRVACQAFGEELQRDGLSELEIVGPVDLAHATLAEKRHDAEAAGEHGPGSEARAVVGWS